MEGLIYDFGVLPDDVTIWNGGPTRANIEVRVRFRVELWRTPDQFELRHQQQTLGLGIPDDLQYLKLMWMRPARGPGFGELRLGAKTVGFPTLLLSGRYDDLDWLQTVAQKLSETRCFPPSKRALIPQTVAQKLSETLEISPQIYDMGSDF